MKSKLFFFLNNPNIFNTDGKDAYLDPHKYIRSIKRLVFFINCVYYWVHVHCQDFIPITLAVTEIFKNVMSRHWLNFISFGWWVFVFIFIYWEWINFKTANLNCRNRNQYIDLYSQYYVPFCNNILFKHLCLLKASSIFQLKLIWGSFFLCHVHVYIYIYKIIHSMELFLGLKTHEVVPSLLLPFIFYAFHDF